MELSSGYQKSGQVFKMKVTVTSARKNRPPLA
jgi:hypothetical protein